jgi:Glycosyltransferase family 92
MYKLSVCAIAKNEHFGLEEWINYNLLVGVEHFYIYDNDSVISIRETLAKYIDKGIVTLIEFPGPSKQMPAYNHCLQNFGTDNQWIAFIDCDEFIVPKKVDYVPAILDQFSSYGGLQVNWMMFGSNGWKERPTGLVIKNYTKCVPNDWQDNLHTKAIVQPKFTACVGDNPHYFRFNSGHFSVSENFEHVPNAWSRIHSVNLIQINHYVIKSQEDFAMKIAKGRADVVDYPLKTNAFFLDLDAGCIHENHDIARFADKVEELYLP